MKPKAATNHPVVEPDVLIGRVGERRVQDPIVTSGFTLCRTRLLKRDKFPGGIRGLSAAIVPSFIAIVASGWATTPLRAGGPGSEAAWQYFHARSVETLGGLARAPAPVTSPAAGVEELSIADLFGPIGDGGLEYAPRARALAGKRVRLSGFMVREVTRRRGVFLLVGRAAPPQLDGNCFAAELPPAPVYVHLPAERAGLPAPYEPGRVVLDGILELGPQRESDGRNSFVRLRLDSTTTAGSDRLAPSPAASTP